MESYRITVPLDPVEDKEIIDRMPKWARGNWIREQVKKAITMQGSTESGDLRKLVEEYLQQQGSVTQNQVRNWISEALQQLPSTAGDQVQEIVANVLQKQMTITEQQVKLWVHEAVSALQVTVHQETVVEPGESQNLQQNDVSSIVETAGELPVLKSYEVLGNEPAEHEQFGNRTTSYDLHEDTANPTEKQRLRRSIQDVVKRRPAVKMIEQNVPNRSGEGKDEYAEYGPVDLTHLGDIDTFGGSDD